MTLKIDTQDLNGSEWLRERRRPLRQRLKLPPNIRDVTLERVGTVIGNVGVPVPQDPHSRFVETGEGLRVERAPNGPKRPKRQRP